MGSRRFIGALLISIGLVASVLGQGALGFVIEGVPPLVPSSRDRFAFSPLKLFDGVPATCMAVRWSDLQDNGRLLVRLRASESGGLEISGFRVGGGFLDAALYDRNARVRKLTLVLKTMQTGGVVRYGEHRQSFDLADVMRIQALTLSSTVKDVYAIEVYVDEIHPGADWQDVCVAELIPVSPSGPIGIRPEVGAATDIHWYCDEAGKPVLGRFRSDHASGVLRVAWEDGRLSRVDSFIDVPEGPIEPARRTWFYERSGSIVTVVGEDGSRLVEYGFDAAGNLLVETRFRAPGGTPVELRHAPSESATIERVSEVDRRVRLDWNGSMSESDRYVDGKLYSSSRAEFWWFLPPVDFVRP